MGGSERDGPARQILAPSANLPWGAARHGNRQRALLPKRHLSLASLAAAAQRQTEEWGLPPRFEWWLPGAG